MTAERVYTITRPTGFQVQVRARSSEELWDGMAAHGWPRRYVKTDAQDAWQYLCPMIPSGTRPYRADQWTVRHG